MSRHVGIVVVAALLLTLGTPALLHAGDEAGADPGHVRLVLPDAGGLEDALVQARDQLGIPLVWDPKSRALPGKEIAGPLVMEGTREEVYEALRSLLTFYELVLIPVGEGPNQRILVMDARQTAAIVRVKPRWVQLTDGNLAEYENQDGLFLTTVIRTEHLQEAGLRDVRNALNRIVTGQNIGNVTEVPSGHALVVTDFAPNVVAIYRLVRQMDVPPTADESDPTRVEVTSVRLQHADAQEAATALGALAASPAPTRGPQAPQAAQAPRTSPDLQVAADARTNQVLLQGTADALARAQKALALLDQPRPDAEVEVQLLRLEHARAQVLVPVLIQLASGMFQPVRGRPATEPRPTIVADTQANVVVVAATAKTGTVIRHLVAELDRDLAPEAGGARTAASDPATPFKERLRATRISLSVDGAALPDALARWGEAAGVPVVVTPLARALVGGQSVTLEISDRAADLVLQMLVNAGGSIRWSIADGAVVIHQQGETF